MAIDRDNPRVKELESSLDRYSLWPKHSTIDTSLLHYGFVMFMADGLGQRPIKLATLDSTTDETSLSLQATFFMDGIIAQCNAKIEAQNGIAGMGHFAELSGIRSVPWASIKAISRTPMLRPGMDPARSVDFDVELPEQTVEVRLTGHQDTQSASQLYNELLEYLANRR